MNQINVVLLAMVAFALILGAVFLGAPIYMLLRRPTRKQLPRGFPVKRMPNGSDEQMQHGGDG